MRNLVIILAVVAVAVYVFIAVNERQKERLIRERLPKFRKIEKYEFDKALYQIRETRTKVLSRTQKRAVQKEQEADVKEDFYKDYEYIESLKDAPSTEAQTLQEPSLDPDQQQLLIQQDLQAQPIQEEPQQATEITTQQQEYYEQLQQQQLQPNARPVRRIYKRPTQMMPQEQFPQQEQ